MPEPDNLVLVDLRRIDEKVDRVIGGDLEVRVTNLEEGQAGNHHRLDQVELRLDRIERHLDLAEAPH
jgi:hypothetical protein